MANSRDFLKKRRQRKDAQKLQKIWQTLWKRKHTEMSPDEAAKKIQAAYRRHCTLRRSRALKMLQMDKYTMACLRLQHIFRKRLDEARERIAEKRDRLDDLVRIQRSKQELTDDEKKTMYELQDELGERTRDLLNHKLLLRPNTRFAVLWKLLFIVAVFIEITQKAARPFLQDVNKKKGDKPVTMEELIANTFVPLRVAELPGCIKEKPKHSMTYPRFLHLRKELEINETAPQDGFLIDEDGVPSYCESLRATLHDAFRDIVALALIPKPVSQWPECQNKPKGFLDVLFTSATDEPKPWYCDHFHVQWHTVYRQIVNFLLYEFLFILSVVMFMDVFVTFFSGEFCPITGELLPKPMFARWTGLLLQLLINPRVANVSQATLQIFQKMIIIGPVRTYRWLITVAFPFSYYASALFITYVWLPYVEFENSSEIMESPFLW